MDKQLDWSRLETIATPEKWLEMYKHYEELLTQSDVAAWYADQFNICCKERDDQRKELEQQRALKNLYKDQLDACRGNLDELKADLNDWDYVCELYYKHVNERYG